MGNLDFCCARNSLSASFSRKIQVSWDDTLHGDFLRTRFIDHLQRARIHRHVGAQDWRPLLSGGGFLLQVWWKNCMCTRYMAPFCCGRSELSLCCHSEIPLLWATSWHGSVWLKHNCMIEFLTRISVLINRQEDIKCPWVNFYQFYVVIFFFAIENGKFCFHLYAELSFIIWIIVSLQMRANKM